MKFQPRMEVWSNGLAVGLLSSAAQVQVHETMNDEFYVTFFYPKLPDDADRYDALIEENEIRFPAKVERGQIFRIKRVEEKRDGQKLYKQIEAHHIAFTLGQYFYDGYIDFAAAKPIEELLQELADGTPFTFAVEGAFDPQDIFDWGEKSKLSLLHELRALYEAEYTFDNYTITLTTRKGIDNAFDIRYRKNLKAIQRTSHTMERVTRLYGYGKNGLTIEGYSGMETKFIDSPHFDPAQPFMGKVEYPDIDDPGRLLVAMQKYLREHELPKVSYAVDFVELAKTENMNTLDDGDYAVGNKGTIHDEGLNYAVEARINSYTRYPFEPKRGALTLANFRNLSQADYLYRATVESKRAMVYTSRQAVMKGIKYDDSVTIVNGIGVVVSDAQDRHRVELGQYLPGEYGMRVLNKQGQVQISEDDDGNAIFAGMLEAAGGTFSGALQAASGTFAGNLSAAGGTFTGKLVGVDGDFSGTITATAGTIGGWTISATSLSGNGKMAGGTITGTTIQTAASGQRVQIDTGFHSFDSNGVKRVDISAAGNYGYAGLDFHSGNGTHQGTIAASSLGELFIDADHDLTIRVGDGYFLNFVNHVIFNQATVDGLQISSVVGLQGALNAKSNISDNEHIYARNLAFDPSTRNLQMFAADGTVLAIVNIP